jgi:L-phenylalanine/L-methionine N-acetyltransferase
MLEDKGCGQPHFRGREKPDDEGLFELFTEARFVHFASVGISFGSCEDMQDWLANISAAQRFEVVADYQSKIAGFGGLYILGDGMSHSGWIMLGVREEFQGRGIGSSLMHMLVETAYIFVGLRRLQLSVLCENDAAIRLYSKFGFAIEGRHSCYVRRGTTFIDAFTMARIFDDGIRHLNRASLLRIQAGSFPTALSSGSVLKNQHEISHE